jgi:hypothetical protein
VFKNKLGLSQSLGVTDFINKFKVKKVSGKLYNAKDKTQSVDYHKSRFTREIQKSRYI